MQTLIPICASLSKDPVANVRFACAKALTQIVRGGAGSHVDARVRSILSEMQRDDDIDVQVPFAVKPMELDSPSPPQHFSALGLSLCK